MDTDHKYMRIILEKPMRLMNYRGKYILLLTLKCKVTSFVFNIRVYTASHDLECLLMLILLVNIAKTSHDYILKRCTINCFQLIKLLNHAIKFAICILTDRCFN